jgi:peptidyl-prolyl cis-trans isomerase C
MTLFTVVVFSLGACRLSPPIEGGSPIAPKASDTIPEAIDLPTNTPLLPSATPEPLAVLVNGLPITMAEYQAELTLYQDALTRELMPEDEKRVLDDLIDNELLAQGAKQNGFKITDELLSERLDALAEQLGSQEALDHWIETHQYTQEQFRRVLSRSIAAAWMRDQIINSVATTAEQVHIVQILLYDLEEANQVYAQLQAGNDFYNLAIQYDSITGGDLGWVPRGYLPHPNLDEAAFSLQPDTFSPVIETLAGYHILLLVERDPQRALSPSALLIFQSQALEDWLASQRENGQIEILAH